MDIRNKSLLQITTNLQIYLSPLCMQGKHRTNSISGASRTLSIQQSNSFCNKAAGFPGGLCFNLGIQ